MQANKWEVSAQVVLNVFLVIFWYTSINGLFFYDDVTYSAYAVSLLEGNFAPAGDHFGHRIGLIAPLALIYSLFGFSLHTTLLLPLLFGLALVNLVYWLFRDTDRRVGVLAAYLTGLNFYLLYFTKNLYPDLPVAFCILLSFAALYQGRNSTGIARWIQNSISVIAFSWAFLMKETAVLPAFFILFLFVQDLIQAKNRDFWRGYMAQVLLVSVIYFSFYHLAFGHPLYRLIAMATHGHYESAQSYFDKSFLSVIPRLTYQPVVMLVHSGLIIPMVFAFAGVKRIHWKKLLKADTVPAFWFMAGGITLLAFWVMSTSWRYYNPLALFPRHLLMLIPLFAIPAATMLKDADWKYYRTLSFLFLLCLVIGKGFSAGNILLIYLLLLGWAFVMFLVKLQTVRLPVLLKYAVWIILMVHPVYHVWKGEDKGFFDLQAAMENYFPKDKKVIVYTDEMTVYGSDYFYGFQPGEVQFLAFDNMQKGDSAEPVYLLLHEYHLNYLQSTQEKIEQQIAETVRFLDPVYEKGMVRVYLVQFK